MGTREETRNVMGASVFWGGAVCGRLLARWEGRGVLGRGSVREDDPQCERVARCFWGGYAIEDPQSEGTASCFFRGKSVKSLVIRKGCGVVER